MIATCQTCVNQVPLEDGAEQMRVGRGYERWCKCCGKTTWQFVGFDTLDEQRRTALRPGRTRPALVQVTPLRRAA